MATSRRADKIDCRRWAGREQHPRDHGRDTDQNSRPHERVSIPCQSLLVVSHMNYRYWRKPEATAKERTSDGWWKTGDMAVIKAEHNNATFIQGRASADIIKSGGYKISALDIETAMLQLPFVEEVAVVGVPDTTWGEVVAAICVPAEGKAADLTVANLREKLRSELAPYKLPQKLHILDQMPRNAMGKVQKKALREQCFPTQRAAKL